MNHQSGVELNTAIMRLLLGGMTITDRRCPITDNYRRGLLTKEHWKPRREHGRSDRNGAASAGAALEAGVGTAEDSEAQKPMTPGEDTDAG
jgi:hypothetical protein